MFAAVPSPERGRRRVAPQDEELVAQTQAGDKDALQRLVRRHQSWVFNIASVWSSSWAKFLASVAKLELR
jgi:hypothetical protein